MNKILTFLVGMFCTVNAFSEPNLIISQYYEGTSYNKWIELTNIGTSTVQLNKYQVALWSRTASDGTTIAYEGDPSQTAFLEGSLEAGHSLLLGRSTNNGEVSYISDYDTINGVTNFNGNDGFALLDSSGTIVDRFLDGIAATDISYTRLNTVTSGNVASPLSEWNMVEILVVQSAQATDDSYLGNYAVKSLKPSLTLLSPTDAEEYQTNDTIPFKWEYSGTIDTLELYVRSFTPFSFDWNIVTDRVIMASDTIFLLAVPRSVVSGTYQFGLVAKADTTVYSLSDTLTFVDTTYPEIAIWDGDYMVHPYDSTKTSYPTDLLYEFIACTFEDNLHKGKGKIRIIGANEKDILQDGGANSNSAEMDTFTFDVTSEDVRLTLDGETTIVSVNLPRFLQPSFYYYVEMDSGVFIDQQDKPFQGINKDSELPWTFATSDYSSVRSIASIQDYTGNADGSSTLAGVYTPVKTAGIVTLAAGDFYLIQDSEAPLSGITVRDTELEAAVGDSISVIGYVIENEGSTEIASLEWKRVYKLDKPRKFVTPMEENSVNEDYESMFVLFGDVIIKSVSEPFIRVSTINGQIDINPELADSIDLVTINSFRNLEGFLLHDNWQYVLFPIQLEGDFYIDDGVSDNELSASCNCLQDGRKLTCSSLVNTTITIIDMSGKSLFESSLSTQVHLDLSAWHPGIYLVKFTDESGSSFIKKIVLL